MTAPLKRKTVSIISTFATKLCNTVLYHRLGFVFSDGVQAFGGSREVPVSDDSLHERRFTSFNCLVYESSPICILDNPSVATLVAEQKLWKWLI